MSHNKYKIFEKICIGCGKQFIITSRNIKRRKLRGRPDTLCTACMHAQDIVEKYGEERAKQLLENLNAKRIKTNLRKYNVKNVHQHPDVIKKTVETNVKNHGVESVMQIPEVRAGIVIKLLPNRETCSGVNVRNNSLRISVVVMLET